MERIMLIFSNCHKFSLEMTIDTIKSGKLLFKRQKPVDGTLIKNFYLYFFK